MPLPFSIQATDGSARAGCLTTTHGVVQTPAFMPVGTRAAVTGLTAPELRELGAEMILGNTYHLALRPGPEAMRQLGGLHRFMGWERGILTDSGGFQIFSLAQDRVVNEDGARFRSYVDGREHLLTPESSIAMQEALGSDVMMVLDVCPPSSAKPAEVEAAMQRTHRWALRSLAARRAEAQALFAIVQGGLSLAWRAQSAEFLAQHAFDGFAIGGVAVGDTRSQRSEVIAAAAERLPQQRPRYLMGVGTPPEMLLAIAQGVDMFDCVLPTSLAFQGTAFTSTGRVRLARMEHRLADVPLDAACTCATCRSHPRSYLHHLMKCRESLVPRLLAVHNLHHYLELMRRARAAIQAGHYTTFLRTTLQAIDRHEHDASARAPGRRHEHEARGEPQPPAVLAPRFEIVTTTSGAPAVLDRDVGEVMHPGLGATAEAEQLYVTQARLAARLFEGGAPLVLFDVGLGAAANALAALRCARAAPAGSRRLLVYSFERDLGALAVAASVDGTARLQWSAADRAAAIALLEHGEHEEPGFRWQLLAGDALEALARAPQPADVVFWDPWSPRRNAELWTARAFATLRAHCSPGASLFTYSRATAVRSALLLAGFHVGSGAIVGTKETTAAALAPTVPAQPLDRRWLARLQRSSAAWPSDVAAAEVPAALRQIAAHPQFAPT
ncbi:MAG: tRNA guanosine(34) transglycosylase Tgt [Planctomycetota bacterium]